MEFLVAAALRAAAVRRKATVLALGPLADGRVQRDPRLGSRAARAGPRAEHVALKAALLLGTFVAGDLGQRDEDVFSGRLA